MSNLLDLKHPEGAPNDIPDEEVQADAVSEDDSYDTPLLDDIESISWDVEHTLTERERMREYMLLGGVAIIGTAVSWWQSSWLTFIVIILGIAAWELHNRLPATHRVTIDGTGISVGGYHHRYEHLHSYDIHEMPDGSARLSIKTTRWNLPHLHIPLGEQDPQEVHMLLSYYMLKGDHKIPLIDYFIKK